MKIVRFTLTFLAWLSLSEAFIGLGKQMYSPTCATACYDTLKGLPLSCSVESHGPGGHHGGGGKFETTPECRAGDTPFLASLAFCMNLTCSPFGVDAWKLEKFWHDKATANITVYPKWTYAEALASSANISPQEWDDEAVLKGIMLAPEKKWKAEKDSDEAFEYQETLHSRYGLALLVVGFSTPIVFTALGYLPYINKLLAKLEPILVYPSLIGNYHVRPLPYLLGNAPTIGQALYIAMFFTLNLVLTAIDYSTFQGNTWFESRYQELLAYIANRTGVIAFALAPLVVLFAGRNNFLLWITNWSHSTFMLLHRWIARIFVLQCIVHSIVELALHLDIGDYQEELIQAYWIWGAVATVAGSAMLIFSLLFMRRWSYEIFLVLHVLLAAFVLIGSWYHIDLLFERRWGYEYWLYAAFAVWFFDRSLRVLRIANVGVREATVTDIPGGIVRVDIEGVRWTTYPGQHAYVHFPRLSPLRPWENHPFSIVPTALLNASHSSHPSSSSPSGPGSPTSPQTQYALDLEKSPGAVTISPSPIAPPSSTRSLTTAGITFYIRRSSGLTSLLSTSPITPALLDGPYRNNETSSLLRTDRLLLLAGGIGITGVLPYLGAHSNARLCWAVKTESAALVKELGPVLERAREREVSVGKRVDVGKLVREEGDVGWGRLGVVVCGPAGMCDEVREAVVRVGRGVVLEVNAFSW